MTPDVSEWTTLYQLEVTIMGWPYKPLSFSVSLSWFDLSHSHTGLPLRLL